jgi:L-asparaginase / beta-aspartyl-peptidase
MDLILFERQMGSFMTTRKFEDEKGESRRTFLDHAVKGLGAAALGANLSGEILANSKSGSSMNLFVQRKQQFGFVIHGGAGTILKREMTPELEKQYREKLTEALSAGYEILNKDGASLDAVEAAIRIMEDSPLFNAGKGAVFTSAGTNELDASVMDGSNLKAGAVSVLTHIKNPISLARMVMERSPHVMLVGEGAETFAKQQGVEFVPQSYFFTEKRWKQYEREKAEDQKRNAAQKKAGLERETVFPVPEYKLGTVGAAALDKKGNLAAGTSTGGISYKRFGRVGDSPIIGAGTYANNQTCAVSATGDGEYFIRVGVARDISALMEYAGKPLVEASQIVIDKVGKLGGTGGVICIDKDGNIAEIFNTEGMYRGHVGADGKVVVEIYKD